MRIGFEIHQQLDTRKLFCDCPSLLREDAPSYRYLRSLRPTQSELGEIDLAALKEFLKGKRYLYQGYSDTTCLVEIDEEPPHSSNTEALDIAIEAALLLGADIVEEVHFMRKLVIDGSNTSGFQRTAVVASDGRLKIGGLELRIPTICLEEEAARKIGEEENQVIYRLDRLGIPLVEITTAPDIKTLDQAKEVALKIGELLRSTAKVKRGLGTIRQDINVSVKGGSRVEIKGVQDLNQVPRVIEKESERQRMLVKVKKELVSRRVSKDKLELKIKDVTEFMKKSGFVKRQLAKGTALALLLPGFGSLLKEKLGPELAQHARIASGVGGIIHSDELPGYGVAAEEVEKLSTLLGKGEKDAFVMALAPKRTAENALRAVFERALMALGGVPEETRVANPDATTSYMRPLPGAARMYPETDIPPIAITKERIARIKAGLPESYEEKKNRYMKKHGLSEELASQLIATSASFEISPKASWQIYEGYVEMGVKPSIAAATVTSTFKDLKRDKVKIHLIPQESITETLKMASAGEIAKEAVPEVLRGLAARPEKKPAEISAELGLKGLDEKEIRKVIKGIIDKKADFVKENGMRSAKPLMGLVMKEVRGKVDGKLVNQLLNEELERVLSGAGSFCGAEQMG